MTKQQLHIQELHLLYLESAQFETTERRINDLAITSVEDKKLDRSIKLIQKYRMESFLNNPEKRVKKFITNFITPRRILLTFIYANLGSISMDNLLDFIDEDHKVTTKSRREIISDDGRYGNQVRHIFKTLGFTWKITLDKDVRKVFSIPIGLDQLVAVERIEWFEINAIKRNIIELRESAYSPRIYCLAKKLLTRDNRLDIPSFIADNNIVPEEMERLAIVVKQLQSDGK